MERIMTYLPDWNSSKAYDLLCPPIRHSFWLPCEVHSGIIHCPDVMYPGRSGNSGHLLCLSRSWLAPPHCRICDGEFHYREGSPEITRDTREYWMYMYMWKGQEQVLIEVFLKQYFPTQKNSSNFLYFSLLCIRSNHTCNKKAVTVLSVSNNQEIV